MAKKIIINNVEVVVEVDDAMPLLWFLRDTLEYTGTKFGCGAGLCGACTVLVDGVAMRSCLTPVASLIGKKITTIEGLSEDGSHPLQKAWVEHKVPQCGYCQAGQIMTAAGFLNSNNSPSEQDIETAMAGNICRCGTYQRIKKAVKAAADELATEVK